MTVKTTSPWASRNGTSRNLQGSTPRIDKARDAQEAIVDDADENRDLVHGDGGTIDLPTKPDDLSKDD
ncbi:hypothetical protein [Bradyrhizobium liaoningense]